MNSKPLPDNYRETISAFNHYADQYLAYFKDFKLYQPSYDGLLQAMGNSHQTVLDIACGPGQVDYYLLQSRPELQITGVDLAPRMIELAKRLNPDCNYHLLDCRAVDSLNAQYDVIVCGFCLPYLSYKDMKAMLNKMVKILNNNGIIYLSTTSSDEPDGYQTSQSADGRTYVYYHDIDFIKSQLEKAGCSLLKHEQIVHIHNGKETKDEFVLVQKLKRNDFGSSFTFVPD